MLFILFYKDEDAGCNLEFRFLTQKLFGMLCTQLRINIRITQA